MVEIVEDGAAVRISTPANGGQRILARVLPVAGAIMIITNTLMLAGIGHTTAGRGDSIAMLVLGVLFLATLWVGLGTTVTIDPASRLVRVRKRYAYRPSRATEIAFPDIREIEIFRDTWRRDPWISVWLHRHEGRWMCLAGPTSETADGAAIERASELAHARIGAPITRTGREPIAR